MRAGVSAAIALAIVAILLLAGIVLMPMFFEEPQGFEEGSLVAPEVYLDPQIVPWKVRPTTTTQFDHDVQLSWVMTPIYASYGGALNLTVESQSSDLIYIYGFGVDWPLYGVDTSRPCSVNLTSGEEATLGLIFFSAPDFVGRADYRIFLELAVQSSTGEVWHDYGTVVGKQWDTDVLACAEPSTYDISNNPRNYYDKATSLMDRDAVTALTAQVRALNPGNYSLQQLLYAFDWVRKNIEYADDPTDLWQNAKDTMMLRSGDCEDHAILMATLIRELGGSARFNLIEGHAFATVFIGDSYTDLTAIKLAVSSHYGTIVPVHYLQDSSGYWMTMDTVGFPYAGGLTANSVPVLDGQVDWTFEDTNVLIKVDAIVS
jgi:transglutaminase-like putative cysteine protease